jgi:hypothetical protein
MSFIRIIPIFILLIVSNIAGKAQFLKGTVIDSESNQPLEGITVTVLPVKNTTVTDQFGNFSFKKIDKANDQISVSSIGYESKSITINDFKKANSKIRLSSQDVELKSVVISSRSGDQYKVISKTDIAMRGVNNSQEVLRIIPGIVIGQHQGGGKAEQIFLRGFDADHGTDFRLDVDGLPINMVSHAHGQGFADSHFIIPETIDNVDFKKGSYDPAKGDFVTTGFVDYNTRNSIKENIVKVEAGQFKTLRFMTMLNLLSSKAAKKEQSLYVAFESRYSNAYFDNPQHFKRINLFTKYNGKISQHSYLNISATAFWSKWDASGQIPDRAVDKGLIGFYGAIDPFEGGITYRENINARLTTSFNNGDILKNQLYYSNSHFDLHTNFTFFLEDTVNGDEIRQREARNLMGYNGSYSHVSYMGKVKLSSEFGLQLRNDVITNAELSHTKDRFITLKAIKFGDILETSISPYVSETFKFNEHFSINAGLRFDQFFFKYKNKLAGDTTLPGLGTYRATDNTFNPKLNFAYHINDALQLYLTTGKGFHSNDARSVVVEKGKSSLPSTYNVDLGTVFKPAKNIIINAAVWYIYLQQEFVYSGDGGFVEFSGKTKRIGFDFSGRYEPIKSLYFDIDINYAHGRAIGEPKGSDFIPLAPVWTNSAGLTYTSKKGLNGSFRYRFVGDRSANEDYSLAAKGYFITDAVLNYTKPKYEIGVVINNVFNTKWKETQFDTETRLKNEASPVDEVCFTPGTPFAAKLSFTYKF